MTGKGDMAGKEDVLVDQHAQPYPRQPPSSVLAALLIQTPPSPSRGGGSTARGGSEVGELTHRSRPRHVVQTLPASELERENEILSTVLRDVCRSVHGLALALQAPIPDELAFLGCKVDTLDAFLAIVDKRMGVIWQRAYTIASQLVLRRAAALEAAAAAATHRPSSGKQNGRRQSLGSRAAAAAAADATAAYTASEAASASAQQLSVRGPDLLGLWLGFSEKPHRSGPPSLRLQASTASSTAPSRDDAVVLRLRPPGPAVTVARIDSRMLRKHMQLLMSRKEQDDMDGDGEDTPHDGIVFRESLVPRAKLNEYVERTLARCQAETAELTINASSAAKSSRWGSHPGSPSRGRRGPRHGRPGSAEPRSPARVGVTSPRDSPVPPPPP
mmetsp:Transcript_20336/g.51679  ORF Transcript_20336/g.51679 Transcript_20336/m.51679 type:complete len:387 (-) Transcript_20336:13-1173(-)